MKRTQFEMSEDEFDDKYPLIKNHLNPHAGWACGEGPGCLFETYGEELEFVRQQDPCTVWTLVDGDNGDQYLTNGFHFVNRIGYLVSTVAVPEEIDIEVRIAMQEDPTQEADKQVASMLDHDQRLSEIAREHLGIPTLGTRNSDSLDFYDVPVWGLRAALEAAYDAGNKGSSSDVSRLLLACQMVVDRWESGDLAEAARACSAAIAEATAASASDGLPTRFDDFEIHGIFDFAEDGRKFSEQVPDDQAQYWSMFGHIPGRGIECIGEFETRKLAEHIYARITGRHYGSRF